MLLTTRLVPALLALAPALLSIQDDPLKDIRSKDAALREAAATALAGDDTKAATDALAKAAAKDDDVLVVLAAIAGLEGRADSKSAQKALVDLALESPFKRVRRAAAETLARIDLAIAREEFLKKAKGRTAEAGTFALATALAAPESVELLAESDVRKDAKKIERLVNGKDVELRPLGAAAVLGLSRADHALRDELVGSLILERATDASNAPVVCAALEAIAEAPLEGDARRLAPLLATPKLPSVVERRVERAIAAALGALDKAAQRKYLDERLEESSVEPEGPRIARIAGRPDVEVEPARETLVSLASSEDPGTRAAAVRALDRIGKAAVEVLTERLSKEPEDAPRLQIIEVLGRHAELTGEIEGEVPRPTAALLKMLESSAAARVRSAAAIALGRPEVANSVVIALTKVAESGGSSELGIVATIALGRTRSPGALEPLKRLAGSGDWMVRAAAAEGLKQHSTIECVAPLLALLLDKEPNVSATAHRALLRFSAREGQEVDREGWEAWWKENAQRARFRTKEEEQELAEKYGYGVSDEMIYRGLDVVVIPGRGDHIEGVLDRLGIEYRTVQAGSLQRAGLHPGAILLVGCTGEIESGDVAVVQWFTRSGGALFTSCWALSYTVVPSFPAVIRKFETQGEVLDNVLARPTASSEDSPYLRGVFDGGVEPFYSLQGAHLLEVVDPERATVLLDSPDAAARHGSGDLAAWFQVGHGVVLDTANHFAEQGFSAAKGLDDETARQAFAVNHMGLDLLRLRELAGEKWWRSTSKTAAEVADLSVFRILTNFVRQKRIRG